MEDYYSILGGNENNTNEELKALYRKLILQYHPDKNEKDEEGVFIKIQKAWQILGNEVERKKYDALRKG